MEKFSGSKRLIVLLKAFESCISNDEISSLRGGMVEALVIGCYGGSINLSKPNYGWGTLGQKNLLV